MRMTFRNLSAVLNKCLPSSSKAALSIQHTGFNRSTAASCTVSRTSVQQKLILYSMYLCM